MIICVIFSFLVLSNTVISGAAAQGQELKTVEIQPLLKAELPVEPFPSDIAEILCFGLSMPENDSKKIVDELAAIVEKAEKSRYEGCDQLFLHETKEIFFRKLGLEIESVLKKYSNHELAKTARYCFGLGKMVYTEIIIDILAQRFIENHSLRAVEEIEAVFTHIGTFALIGKILAKARTAETFPIDEKKPDHINPSTLSLRQAILLLEIHQKKGKGSRIDLTLQELEISKSFGQKNKMILELIKKHNGTIASAASSLISKATAIGCCGAGSAVGAGITKACACGACASGACVLL